MWLSLVVVIRFDPLNLEATKLRLLDWLAVHCRLFIFTIMANIITKEKKHHEPHVDDVSHWRRHRDDSIIGLVVVRLI